MTTTTASLPDGTAPAALVAESPALPAQPVPREGALAGVRDAVGLLVRRAAAAARAHRTGVVLVLALAVGAGLLHGINFDGWPGRVNEDEGTYAAQAFAIERWGQISHYSYWYDHPFGGWLFIASYTTLTQAFDRTATAVTAAREAMLWVHVASCVLLYMLSRRLGMRRFFAALAVVLFSVSPLAIWYQRMAFLDNISTMWVLAALVCVASPDRSVGAATRAGIFMAFAFWSKETSLVLLPGVYLLLWQNRDHRNWRFARRNFLGFLSGIAGIYILYAVTKNELFEGEGHVSLWWAVKWQLFDRTPSGSVLDPDSGTRGIADLWLGMDPYLLGAGAVAAVVLLVAVRRFRAVAFLLLMQIVFMARNGYMPYAYVTSMLPFAAICAAGLLDVVAPSRGIRPLVVLGARNPGRRRVVPKAPSWLTGAIPAQRGRPEPSRPGANQPGLSGSGSSGPGPSGPDSRTAADGGGPVGGRRRVGFWVRAAAVACVLALGVLTIPPRWAPLLRDAITDDAGAPSREATQWFIDHYERGQIVITDDNIWTDLVVAGMDPVPVWFYKLDLDPAVRRTVPNGWSDIDYVILGDLTPTTLETLPTVAEAIEHSEVVASFGDGEVMIRKVIPPTCTDGTPRGARCTAPAAGG
ncbi:4-amino-4-deoxy-L-arabinose transferase [Frankia sp. CcI49]|uniref:ArnT family glycosyltransferase n=1 Tax=Frankia sp. CcI49 TaxID=1745382 RepID=UPI000975C311|nr:4-amino-4-deoxy-L-arabinose transferase [Frankia sp. CcI49]ONH60507.1 4-amino-4-deoxy-L-arabinose transferase [Frankia sp. CcI49]